jgi:hypothetical protein
MNEWLWQEVGWPGRACNMRRSARPRGSDTAAQRLSQQAWRGTQGARERARECLQPPPAPLPHPHPLHTPTHSLCVALASASRCMYVLIGTRPVQDLGFFPHSYIIMKGRLVMYLNHKKVLSAQRAGRSRSIECSVLDALAREECTRCSVPKQTAGIVKIHTDDARCT